MISTRASIRCSSIRTANTAARYFEHPDSTIDDAQLARKRHLAAKLMPKPGQRVLDIGCGWGGLGLYLARFCEARVTGITLSREQLAIATSRAQEQHLDNTVDFRMQDYRDVTEQFDRIVSVGMFEHVGVGYYDKFFRKCADILSDDGVIMLHSIGRSERPDLDQCLDREIHLPRRLHSGAVGSHARDRAMQVCSITDIEILRLHYAETLKAWRERFLAHREEVERLYDARFVRMWEFYLAASEMAFRKQNLMVFQLQLTKRQGVVPITRDYIGDAEATFARASRSVSGRRCGWRANNASFPARCRDRSPCGIACVNSSTNTPPRACAPRHRQALILI